MIYSLHEKAKSSVNFIRTTINKNKQKCRPDKILLWVRLKSSIQAKNFSNKPHSYLLSKAYTVKKFKINIENNICANRWGIKPGVLN